MLTVSSLAKSYADITVLRDVSFNLNPGDRVGLIGPNGCGKTTLLRLIAGRETPDKGSVFVDLASRSGYLEQGLEYPPHTLRAYAGSYTDYLEQSLAERERQSDQYRAQEAEIRRMKQDIARTLEQSRSVERKTTSRQPNVRRIAKKVAKKAKSREKKLERYLASGERVDKPKLSWQMKVDFQFPTLLPLHRRPISNLQLPALIW